MEKYHRKSMRLKNYDYTQPAGYFSTILTKDRKQILSNIQNCAINLNDIGEIAKLCWEEIPKHFSNVILDTFCIMPNHIHGIIIIHGSGMAMREAPFLQARNNGPKRQSIGAIVGSFKSAASKYVHRMNIFKQEEIWHRNYYEHIIKDEIELDRIRKYILENPIKWEFDKENPESNCNLQQTEDWMK